MLFRLILAAVLGLALAAGATALVLAAPAYDRSFGNLLYRIPPGYAAAQPAGGLTLALRSELAGGELTGVLLVPQDFALTPELRRQAAATGRAALALALATAAGDLTRDPKARASDATLANTPARDGYEVYQVDSRSFDAAAGKTRYARTLVVFVKDRVHLFIVAGYGSEAAFRAQLPGFEALLASGEFRNLGHPPPARAAPPLPASLAAAGPPRQAAAPPPGQRRCRTVQRQMCSGGIGTSLGYFCNTYPQQVCD